MTHDPESGRKLRDLLRELGYENPEETTTDAVLAKFFPETDMDVRVLEIVFEHAFRYFFLHGKVIYESLLSDSGNVAMRAFDDQMDRFLQRKTRLESDQRRRLRQNIKQAVLASKSSRPKRRTREKLLERQKHRHCYLCGLEIQSDQEQSLDHRWPLSAGGGNGGANLFRAHKHCDEIKADIAFASDTAYGRIAYSQLPRFLEEPIESDFFELSQDLENATEYLDRVRSAQMRVGVLQRQNHKCRKCDEEFRDVGKAVLSKRNSDEPWWFNNIEALCKPCYEENLKNV